MEFVGNKNTIYNGELPATEHYPALNIADFQTIFAFLSNESEVALTHQLTIARAKVHSELKATIKEAGSLAALSEQQFGDEVTGEYLYKESVFALAASFVVAVQISTDTTKEAAARQQALDAKKDDCEVKSRRAIDMLLNGYETLRFEVI